MDDGSPKEIPFTLVCAECDAGTEIQSKVEALACGWISITYAPDLPMANFVGLCPECRRDELDSTEAE